MVNILWSCVGAIRIFSVLLMMCVVSEVDAAGNYSNVRLRNGWSSSSGRVEIWVNNFTWATICGRGSNPFAAREAFIICGQLGYSTGYPYVAGGGIGVVTDVNFVCPTNATTPAAVASCQYKWTTVPNCTHDEDVGVVCLKPNSPPTQQTTPYKSLLRRVVNRLLSREARDELQMSTRAFVMYPRVKRWALSKWRSGILGRLIRSQMNSALVQDIIQPVVRKLLSTNTGSILFDALMSESNGALQSALSALRGSYRLVPREWASKATLQTLLKTISRVTDLPSQDSRLDMRGLVDETAEVLHVLLRSSMNSIYSHNGEGSLTTALQLKSWDEKAILYDLLESLDSSVETVRRLEGLPKAILSVFFRTHDSYSVRQAWGALIQSGALTADQLPDVVDWAERLWTYTGEPVFDSLLRYRNSYSGRQFTVRQMQPILTSLNSALYTFYYSTGLGDTIAEILTSQNYATNVSINDVFEVINASRSLEPELFIKLLSKKIAHVGAAVGSQMPPHMLLRDGLIFVQQAVNFILNITGPGGPFGQFVQALEPPLQIIVERNRIKGFIQSVSEVQRNLEHLIYSVYAYPASPPRALYFGPTVELVGSNITIPTNNVTVALRTPEDFYQSRLDSTAGVCAMLLVDNTWMSPLQCATTLYRNGTAGDFRLAFNNVPLRASGIGPKQLRVVWFNQKDNAEIASGYWEVLVSSSKASGSCDACQTCLGFMGPVATRLIRSASNPAAVLPQARQAVVDLATITGVNLDTLASYLNFTIPNKDLLYVVARAGFLCSRMAGLCSSANIGPCTQLTAGNKTDGSPLFVGSLDACTVEGIANSTLAYRPPENSCRMDADCNSGSQCVPPTGALNDAFNTGGEGLSFGFCYPTGVCVPFCNLSRTLTQISALNAGVRSCNATATEPDTACASDEDCKSAPSSCSRWSCDPATQALVKASCPGVCQPRSFQMVSAVISDDGKAISITLNAPALALPLASCIGIFESGSFALIGGASASCKSAGDVMTVYIGPGATLNASSTLTLLSTQSRLVWRFNSSNAFTGSVQVQVCANCTRPQAQISGPSIVAVPCNIGNSTTNNSSRPSSASLQPLEFDASTSSDLSGRSFANVVWEVVAAPGGSSGNVTLQAAVDRMNSLTSIRNRLVLTLNSTEITALEIGAGYRLKVTLTSWLGTSSSAEVSFNRTSSDTQPVVQVVGPSVQTFRIKTGIRATAGLEVGCTGKALNWVWSGQDSAATALLRNYTTTSQQLYVPGPITSVTHGQSLRIRLSGSYKDAAAGVEPATADATFTAVGSDPVPRLLGPSGDWPDNTSMVFNASASFDPDIIGTDVEQLLNFDWQCSVLGDASTPCFLNASRGNISSSGAVWAMDAGLLESGKWYVITVTVSKTVAAGASPLQNSASVNVRPRSASENFPRGNLTRQCSLSGCSGLHSTDAPLTLSLRLAAASRNAFVTWSCSAIPNLGDIAAQQSNVGASAAAGTTRLLVIPARLLPTNETEITIVAAMSLSQVQGIATVTVGLNAAPYCSTNVSSPVECLKLEVNNNRAPYASLLARADGWQDRLDGQQLRYEFGVQAGANSSPQMKARGTATSASIMGLQAGEWAVYVCAIDMQGSRTCTSRNVTILDAPESFDGASALAAFDISSTVNSNDQGALLELANQATAILAIIQSKSNNASSVNTTSTAQQEQVVATVTTSIATALLASVNGSQDREQVLQITSVLVAMASNAAEILQDSSRSIYAVAARMATAALISSAAESTEELLNSVKDICKLLATRLPRGRTSTSSTSSRMALRGQYAERTSPASTETLAAQSSLNDLVTLGSQLGEALVQQATPGGSYIASGDQGVYVSAAVVSSIIDTSAPTTVYLRAGPTAAAIAAGGMTSVVGEDAELQVILVNTTAQDAASSGIVLQYAPTSSTAVTQATTGLLYLIEVTVGALATLSWSPDWKLAGDSHMILDIPAPGFDTAKETFCVLYNIMGDTLSQEGSSFVNYNASTGVVRCNVTKMGSYTIVQRTLEPSIADPSPIAIPSNLPTSLPPSNPTTRIFMITLVFKLSSSDKLPKNKYAAFKSSLLNALVGIYDAPLAAVTITSFSGLRVDNTVQVQVQLTIPYSRSPSDGGAAEGFTSNPKSKFSTGFINEYGIEEVTLMAGFVEVAAVQPEDSGSKLSRGKLAGIVVGCVVGGLLVIAVIVAAAIYFHHRQKQEVMPISSGDSVARVSQQQSGPAMESTAEPIIVRPSESSRRNTTTVVVTSSQQQLPVA